MVINKNNAQIILKHNTFEGFNIVSLQKYTIAQIQQISEDFLKDFL